MLGLLCWIVVAIGFVAMSSVGGNRVNGVLMGLIPVGVIVLGEFIAQGDPVVSLASSLGAAILAVVLFRNVRQAHLDEVMAELESGAESAG